jgi:hypothetical protein
VLLPDSPEQGPGQVGSAVSNGRVPTSSAHKRKSAKGTPAVVPETPPMVDWTTDKDQEWTAANNRALQAETAGLAGENHARHVRAKAAEN